MTLTKAEKQNLNRMVERLNQQADVLTKLAQIIDDHWKLTKEFMEETVKRLDE